MCVGAVKSGPFFLNNSLFLLLFFLLLFICGISGIRVVLTFFSFIRINAVVLMLTTVLPPGVWGSWHIILFSHAKYSVYEQQCERTTAKPVATTSKTAYYCSVLNNVTKCGICQWELKRLTFYMQWRCTECYFYYLFYCKPNILDSLNPIECGKYGNINNTKSILCYKVVPPTKK